MTTETLISQFAEDLAFDALKEWCAILGIDYEEPMTDDEWPDWVDKVHSDISEELYRRLGAENEDN